MRSPSGSSVQLTEDGVPDTATVARAWAGKVALDSADDSVWAGATELSLATKGWTRPLDEGVPPPDASAGLPSDP